MYLSIEVKSQIPPKSFAKLYKAFGLLTSGKSIFLVSFSSEFYLEPR